MQCDEFEARLQAAYDERRIPQADPELADHAAGCGECRQLLSAMAAVVESADPVPAVCPTSITHRVLEEMQETVRWRAGSVGDRRNFVSADKRPSRRRAALQFAAAAALVLILPLGSILFRSEADHPEQRLSDSYVMVEPNRPAAQRPVDQNRSELEDELDVLGDDVRQGLAPVAHSTVGALESLWQVLSPEDSRS